MLRRIDTVQAGSHHRRGAAPRAQGAAMGRSVDAQRKSAADNEAHGSQLGRKVGCQGQSGPAGIAAAHDGDMRTYEHGLDAAHKQRRGRLMDFAQ